MKEDAAALEQAKKLVREGKRLEARRLLTQLYLHAGPALRPAAREALDAINRELVFNPQCTEGATIHVVERGQMLQTIARQYKVPWQAIARINAIDRPERVREKQKLKIITGPPEILIDKSDFRLALFINGEFIKEYRIGHGKDNKTPTGTFVIEQMMVRPDWYPPEGGVIKYGEKGYLIGERWMGFQNQPGATGLGIHGTSEPETIGTLCSNGCIRLLNEEVVELYDFVTPGTKVTIVE